jgi:Leucine-rich repeat (LRR) protein
LKRLALAHNYLTRLPAEMGDLRLLRDFSIVGNQVKVPNQQVLNSGMEAVLEYLYSLGQSEEKGELLLDGMAFSDFPDEVLEIKNLVHLSLCSNQISVLPEGINKLITLQRLFVSDNRIETLPTNLAMLEGLVIFEAEKNYLSTLPERFGFLPDVEVLVLNRNKFQIVPLELGYLKKLRILEMDGNLLLYPFNVLISRGFSHLFGFLDSVATAGETKIIDLGGIQFARVPEALEEESYAEKIILHGNSMTEVPSFVHNPDFTALQGLNLAENMLKDLPLELFKIGTLTHLDLAYNRLRNLPDFLGNLSLLTELNVSHNNIVALPQIMASKLTGLAEFCADHNFIRSVPSLANMTALTVLSVMDNRLSSMDSSEAHRAAQLREIWVSRNEMSLLPPWLCDRKIIEYIDIPLRDTDPAKDEDATTLKLKTRDAIRIWVPGLRMDLANLGLEEIPNDIWKKAEIGNLNLAGNRLKEVPKQIGILVNLTQIYFVHNQLDELPDAFGTLNLLKVCRLDHNFFEEIPKCIYKLRNLEKLTMSFNSLKYYFESMIGQLQELKVHLCRCVLLCFGVHQLLCEHVCIFLAVSG